MTDEEATALRERVAGLLGARVETVEPLAGGEVGTVRLLALADGRRVVAKTGPTDGTREARMLRHLGERGLPVPPVVHAEADLLVLGYVPGETGTAAVTPAAERAVADALADLHGNTAERFGFPVDTPTGPYRQPNPWTDEWPAFFGAHRLAHAADGAREAGVLPAADRERVGALVADLPALLGHDPTPALIHGDAWAGNVVVGEGERGADDADDGARAVAAFLDPACYYADREVELAYVAWTGLGGEPFRERYERRAGVPPGADEREPVYRLYPLLVHLRYFGTEYLEEVRETLSTLGY